MYIIKNKKDLNDIISKIMEQKVKCPVQLENNKKEIITIFGILHETVLLLYAGVDIILFKKLYYCHGDLESSLTIELLKEFVNNF